MLRVLSISCVLFLCIMASLSWECVGQTDETTPVVELSPEAAACKDRLIAICVVEQHRFTPPVREAYLAFAKAKARGELDAQGKALPDEFLAWLDADPEMEAGVYGARPNASDVLLMLYSLRLDLGQADFEEYRHLMLASAITHADLAAEADLTPREPLELVIGGDPRQPVDTNDPNRELDMNDHIINFLNSTTIESEHDVDLNRILPGLEYDERGIAIPEPEEDYFPTTQEKEKWLGQYTERIDSMLSEYRQTLLKSGFNPESVITRSALRYCPSIAQCILAEQEHTGYSTIVVGRQGLSRSEEFLFGSISSKIVNHARKCTVWVVE